MRRTATLQGSEPAKPANYGVLLEKMDRLTEVLHKLEEKVSKMEEAKRSSSKAACYPNMNVLLSLPAHICLCKPRLQTLSPKP